MMPSKAQVEARAENNVIRCIASLHIALRQANISMPVNLAYGLSYVRENINARRELRKMDAKK